MINMNGKRSKKSLIANRIISPILVLFIVLYVSFPCFADDTYYLPGNTVTVPGDGGTYMAYDISGLSDVLIHMLDVGTAGTVNKVDMFLQCLGLKDGDYTQVCSSGYSPNGRHSFVRQHTQVNDVTGYFYVCEYCGQSAGEVFDTGYTDFVSDLPATGCYSDGALLIEPDYLGCSVYIRYDSSAYGDFGTFHSLTKSGRVPLNVANPDNTVYTGFIFSSEELSLTSELILKNNNNKYPALWEYSTVSFTIGYTIPESGLVYLPNVNFNLDGRSYDDDYYSANGVISFGSSVSRDSGGSYSSYKGQSLYSDLGISTYYNSRSYKRIVLSSYCNYIRFVPDSGLLNVTSGDTYNINSRPTSITGDYGIIGDNGQISVIENQTIVNETNNTYTNPATGLSGSITNWSYDYSDRSYNLTVQTTDESTGDTIDNSVSVTYGDENVTIVEGDTTYNIYYVLQQPEVEQPEPTEHVHSYTGTVTTQPGCTTTGVKTYTCSECNDTYTETLPALGHDWTIKKQVNTTYDDSGQLVEQGYTIYRCSRCGEEYRSNDSVNPSPPSTAAPAPTASPGSDLTVPDSIPSGLQSLRDSLLSFFSDIPEMFGELTEFMQEGWSYIPTEIITLLTFAISLVVLVGIFKLFWR